MKIRGGESHITQSRHLKEMAIHFLPRHIKAPKVRFGYISSIGKVISQNAKFLIDIAADIDALMAANAAILFKKGIKAWFYFIKKIIKIEKR